MKLDFLLGRCFPCLEEMNRAALAWCDEVNGRVHGTTGAIPAQRLPQEGLTPMGERRYDTSRMSVRVVSRDCFISYQGNRYEAPWRLASRPVLVKDDEDGKLSLWAGDELVMVHEKAAGKGQQLRVPGLNTELWQQVLGRRWERRQEQPAPPLPALERLILVGREIPLVRVERRDLSYYEQVTQ